MPQTTEITPLYSKEVDGWITFLKASSKELGENQAKISLVSENRHHAVLLVEYAHRGKSKAWKVHFRGKAFWRSPLEIFKDRWLLWNGFFRRGKVEVLDLSDKPIRCKNFLKSWSVDKQDAMRLVNYACQEGERNFNILGSSSISSSLSSTILNQRSHNCFTWSRERLMIAGINIKPTRFIKFVEITEKEVDNMVAEPMDSRALCHFVRNDDINSLNRWYATPSEMMNHYSNKATKGPAEYILGQYTPLMLAASYGNNKSMQHLLSHGANPYLNVHSRIFWGILGRYSSFDCSRSIFLRWYVGEKKQNEIIHQLNVIDHKKQVKAAVNLYIEKRQNNPDEYKTKLSFFGKNILSLGCSKREKLDAAHAFLSSVDDPRIDLRPYQSALSQGELGKIVLDYKRYSLQEDSQPNVLAAVI